MVTATNIVDQLLNIPYVNNGRDPKNGLDCWGLSRLIAKELFGAEMPDPSYTKFNLLKNKVDIIREHDMSYWVDPVEGQPKLGDFVLVNAIENLPIHIGVYIKDGKFLHAVSGIGVILSEVELWKDKIEGIYRLKEEHKSND